MDQDEKEQLISVTEQPKPKVKKTTLIKAHPLEATCNTFITLMVAVIVFLIILLIVDLGGLIDLSQIKTINNSSNITQMQSSNGTSSTTNPIKFKVDADPSTAQLDNDVWSVPDTSTNTPLKEIEDQPVSDEIKSEETEKIDKQDEKEKSDTQSKGQNAEDSHSDSSEQIKQQNDSQDTNEEANKVDGKTVNGEFKDDSSIKLISLEHNEHQFLEIQRQFE